MGARGPGKKPHNLKVIAGTDRKDRAEGERVELPLVDEIPAAPDWLPNVHAVKEWDRLAPILFHAGLLTEGGLSGLAHMCALHGKIVQIWNSGEAPTGHLYAQYKSFYTDYGLTPLAQGKVAGAGGEKKANRFSNNGKRA